MEYLKVKRENVIHASEQSPMVKTIISRLFPEAFKEEFEVGWYKSDDVLYCVSDINSTQLRVYTISHNHGWIGREVGLSYRLKKAEKATPQEVSSALIKEAKKRGFKEGVNIKEKIISWDDEEIESDKMYMNNAGGTELCIDCTTIFKDGKWAETEDKKEERTSIVDAWSNLGFPDMIVRSLTEKRDYNCYEKFINSLGFSIEQYNEMQKIADELKMDISKIMFICDRFSKIEE